MAVQTQISNINGVNGAPWDEQLKRGSFFGTKRSFFLHILFCSSFEFSCYGLLPLFHHTCFPVLVSPPVLNIDSYLAKQQVRSQFVAPSDTTTSSNNSITNVDDEDNVVVDDVHEGENFVEGLQVQLQIYPQVGRSKKSSLTMRSRLSLVVSSTVAFLPGIISYQSTSFSFGQY